MANSKLQGSQAAQDKKLKLILSIVTGVVIVGLIGTAAALSINKKNLNKPSTVTKTSTLPKGAFDASSKYAYGIPYGTNPKAPVMELWEDFQCPACHALERANGANIRKMAEDGKIYLIYRVVNFLDQNLRNDSSTRAAIAFAAAVDAGFGPNYHDQLYLNQPTQEGAGWTDAQLESYAKVAGITGAAFDTWKKSFESRQYKDWIASSMNKFNEAGHQSTPTVVLDGIDVVNTAAADPAKLAAIVEKATLTHK